MKNKKVVFTLIIQVFCWTIIGSIGFAYFQRPVQAYQLTDAFLGPIFYDQEVVLKVFDHEYPLWESEYGDDGNSFTTHYDGVVRNEDRYGYDQHSGIDYALSYEPVLAAASGIVSRAEWASPDNHKDSYGLHVRINHDNGYQSLYGHLSSLAVTFWQEITVDPSDPGNRQAIIGVSGNTGTTNDNSCPDVEDDPTCGQHLHFELRNGANRPINPYGWNNETTPDPWSIYNPTTTPPATPSLTPWAPGTTVFRGAASEDLWLDYPANPDANAQYPTGMPVIQPTPPTGYITVDNGDANYSENLPSCLQTGTGGYNDDFRFMTITEFGPTPTPIPTATCLARWTILPPSGTPPEDGYYEVYIHIPDTEAHTFTRGAVYSIWHHPTINDPLTEHIAVVAQAAYQDDETDGYFPDPWVYIGRYHFTLDGTEFIEVGNVTLDDDGTGFVVAVDAVKLAPLFDVAPTSTSTPTHTPAPIETPTPAGTPTPLPPSAAYITKISLGSGGKNPAISGTGQYLAYYSNDGDIMRYDLLSGVPEQVATNSYGGSIAISDDGNYIAFAAYGSYHEDVFLYDHTTGESQNLTNHDADSSVYLIRNSDIKIVQVDDSVLVGYTTSTYFNNGTPTSYNIWLYNSGENAPTLINPAISGLRYLRDISADGNEFLIKGDRTLYIYNRTGTGTLKTISPLPRNPDDMAGADFSSNGRYLAYEFFEDVCSPTCTYEGYIYWYDRASPTDEHQEISRSGYRSFLDNTHPRVSDNGRYVFYIASDGNIYRYEHGTGNVNQITLTEDGSGYPNGDVREMEVSGDGRFVAFESYASNLVVNDTNGAEDVFLVDTYLLSGTPLPTATPGDPTPTPKPKIKCFALAILASNDLSNNGIVRQDGGDDSSAPASANDSLLKRGRQFLGKMQQTADMLSLLYRLRDDVMSQTETGLYYTDLYNAHTEELTDLVEADPALFQEAHDTLLLFEPHLTDFLDGNGNTVTVTAAEVQAVQSLLDQFAALGSPALQQAIAAEQARVPLAQFVGKTSNEIWSSLPPPTPAIDIQINYQPASAPIPNGYLIDDGSVFGERSNGYTYGWSSNITITSRDRNNSNSPDQRYDTLLHSQHVNLSNNAIWEIELPNGEYEVYLVAGDPAYFNSYYHILAEGVSIINAAPSSTTRWFEGVATVMISDGRLTLTNGSNSQNNKFNFVHIRSLGTFPTATATNLPTATATNPPLPTATNTPTSTSTSVPATPTPTFTHTSTSTPVSPSPTNTPMPNVSPTSTVPPPSLLSLTPEADAFLYTGNGINYGSQPILAVGQDGQYFAYSIFRFNLQNLNDSISQATLRLYALDNNSTGFDIYQVLNNNWVESEISGFNYSANAILLQTIGGVSSGSWVEIDVTSLINDADVYSLGLASSSSSWLTFSSREGANSPELVIEMTPAQTTTLTSTSRSPTAIQKHRQQLLRVK
ncbi:MAG: DNRLRE domain-containing protein [Anaerolineae bacterium]|nr:DNRLRE domain-containing protein [Anaerolineae bacterium]